MTLDNSPPEKGADPQVEKKLAGRGRKWTAAQRRQAQDAFLEEFATTGIMGAACRKIGVHRSLPGYWSEHDEEFAHRYQQARLQADDVIRQEIYRRAVEGVERRKTVAVTDANGNITSVRTETIREASDTLLIFLAKNRLDEFSQGMGRYEVDEEAIRVIFDAVARAVTDQETLDRIRAEFAKLASLAPAAR